MPQFARFDHTVDDPKPVIGWYDTDFMTYKEMPTEEDLLEVTPEQWDEHMTAPSRWTIVKGELSPYTPPIRPEDELYLKIQDGVSVTFDAAPELSGVYALNDETVASLARDYASGLGLPGGKTFTHCDKSGSPKTFTGDQIVALYKAQRDMLLALNTRGSEMKSRGVADWPDQVAKI